MADTRMSTEISLPEAGSYDLSVPAEAANFLVATQTWMDELRAAQHAARQTLREAADELGQRTFERWGRRIVVDNPSFDRVYDAAKLHDALAEAGLDSDRLSQVITYEPKVDGRIIRELERHPRFKVAIDSAILAVKEKTRRVEVK